jgi:hypothetical protein
MQSVSSTKPKNVYPIPPAIGQKIAELRGLISRFVISQAMILVAIWLVAAFWIFGIIDYLPSRMGAAESPHAVRVVMLTLMILVALYVLYRYLWQLWRVRWSDSSLALLIENKHSEFQSALITTVQAAYPSPLTESWHHEHPQRSSLLELARDQATRQIANVQVDEMVRFRPLQIQLAILGSLLAVSSVIAMSQPAWTYHWTQRFLALADIPWPRSTELGLDGIEMDVPTFTGRNERQRYMVPFIDGIASVPKGQACQLKSWAKLSGKIVPEVCTVFYRDTAGNRGRANMRRLTATQDQQPFVLDGPPLEAVNESLWLSIAGGDSRISNLELKSVDAPQVTKLQLDVTYPEYLQRSTKTVWGREKLEYRTGTRLPQGSQVELVMSTNKPIKRCDFIIVKSGTNKEQAEQPEQSVTLESQAAEFQIPLGSLDGNLLLELRLWGEDGICSSRIQQFVISAIVDQVPQVDLVLQGIGTSVTENAVLPAIGKVKDDYDLESAWLETVLNENPLLKSMVAVQTDGKATSQLDLKTLRDSGELNATVGSTISLTLAAKDFLDLNQEPHVGRASPIQLGVVTPDQLLIILERRELAMRARLEQIIGELSQLRDLLINMQKANQPTTNSESTNNEEVASPNSEDSPDDEKESQASRQERLQLIRAQQATQQMTKSEGELRGVEKEIHQINQELINNRVDSADRRTRLEDKIRKPMLVVLDTAWPLMANDINALEKSLVRNASRDTNSEALIKGAIAKDNQIISDLTAILNDMTDIQDFNELLDMARGILDDSGKLLEKTQQERKKQVLELLK